MHRYTAKIILRSDTLKLNGKATLCLQCFINGKRKVIPLNVDVEPKYFDKGNEKVRIPRDKKRTGAINAIIHKTKSKAEEIFFQAITYGAPLTRENLCSSTMVMSVLR